jgi:phage terminase large subunit
MAAVPVPLAVRIQAELIAREFEQAILDKHHPYRSDPVGWAVKYLGITEDSLRWSMAPEYLDHLWDGDQDPLVKLYQAVAEGKDAGVESGTGIGKSFGVAVLILWFLSCWENSRVFTFAPKEDQLRLYIWMELDRLWPRFQLLWPSAIKNDLAIRMRGGQDDSWGARGVAVGVAVGEQVSTKASGMHAQHMLLVYEEMQLIPQPVIEAGKNACTAPHNLKIGVGNPNHQLDSLHKFCVLPTTVHVRASALDHPNVVTGDEERIPGAVSRSKVAQRLLEYGAEDPIYQSRVRGISPAQASNALIHFAWLEQSAARYDARVVLQQTDGPITGKGVDVANSQSGDEAAICDFQGNLCGMVRAFPCPDSNALGRQVKLEMQASALEARRVGVDGIGVGAGTVNELRRLGQVVMDLQAGGKAMKMIEKQPDGSMKEWTADVNKFRNLRAQMYWQAREDLRLGRIDVKKDEELWQELVEPTYVDDPVVLVEPKDDIKERLGRSPNKADAFVMANWVRLRTIDPPGPGPVGKQPDRALPMKVVNGRLVPRKKEPHTIEEMQDQAESRMRRGYHPDAPRRRKYS